MGFDVETVKTDLKRLLKQGNQLYLSLAYSTESGAQKEEAKKYLEKNGVDVKKFPDFQTEYEVWYSEALQYIKTFIPDRTNDFVALYKNEKRKELTFASYTISDAIIGLCATRAGEVVVNNRAAVPKMRQQVSILESALKLVDSVIYSIQFSVRAELFDSELIAANELLKAGFLRESGAMCGVILEKHLSEVCTKHTISLRKKSPTINDYNEELKNAGVIDLPTWRHIQLLGDLRNLCCHDKKSEPTKDQVKDLLDGTTKICKTVY